ncbi:hypothetical protein [Empedobacter tilapiae]|uniref:Uncharacterized protein n=1 Tax=Empedobacter tilapiae TaxID=2491114 RepID=A0A4Z1BWJ0_9FLAO|nr:hypothetical protein [Empedobacter tilapiae]TGN27872.1 hypothetical protein E4J94_06575 [Empedobacter tilapiae]
MIKWIKKLKHVGEGKIYFLFLYLCSLNLSAQVYVKENTILYGFGDTIVSKNEIIQQKKEAEKTQIFITKGTTIVNLEKISHAEIVSIDNTTKDKTKSYSEVKRKISQKTSTKEIKTLKVIQWKKLLYSRNLIQTLFLGTDSLHKAFLVVNSHWHTTILPLLLILLIFIFLAKKNCFLYKNTYNYILFHSKHSRGPPEKTKHFSNVLNLIIMLNGV